MGCRMARFEATALINSNIDQNSSWLHQFQHISCDKVRCLSSRDQDTANDDIDIVQLLTDIVLSREHSMDIHWKLHAQLTKPRKRDIRNCDISSHACSHTSRSLSYCTASQDKNLSRKNTGDTADQLSFSAFRLLEIIGTVHDTHPSCYLTHRNEKRQRTIGLLYCLIGKTYSTTFDHCFRQRLVTCEMEISEKQLVLTNQRVFRLYRLFHFHNHVSCLVDILNRWEDLCPNRLIRGV